MPISPSSKGGTSIDCSDILARQKRKIMLAIQNSKPVKGGQTQIANREFGFNSAFSLSGLDSYLVKNNVINANPNPTPNPNPNRQAIINTSNAISCWNYVDSSLSETNGVAYANGKWLVVGNGLTDDTTIISSTTGTDFVTSLSVASFNFANGVAYGNGKWVAVGGGTNNMFVSADNANTWNPVSGIDFDTGYGVAYGNGKWVAVGSGTYKMFVSADNADTWNAVGGIGFNTGYGVVYANGIWVAVGSGGLSGETAVYVSTDANTWTAWNTVGLITEGFVGNCVAYGNGKWIIGGNSNSNECIFVSDDNANNWYSLSGLYQGRGGSYQNGCDGVAHDGNNTWVLVGYSVSSTDVFVSIDNASTWYRSDGANGSGSSVAYGNGRWVQTGKLAGQIFTTTNPKC